MKLRIANYAVQSNRKAKGTHKLVIQGPTKEIHRIFDDGGVSLDLVDKSDRTFELIVDPESRYHFGKDIKGLRRVEVFHSTEGLEAFGVVEVQAMEPEFEEGIAFSIPTRVHAPVLRGRRKQKKPAPPAALPLFSIGQEITLRQAVEAVNKHKEKLGDDLALRVDNQTGRLRALIEY